MKKQTIVIIILSGLLAACLISIFLFFFFQKEHENALTKKNDEIISKLNVELTDRNNRIEDLKNNPVIKIVPKYITKEILVKMTDVSKDKSIFNLQSDNKELRTTIDKLFDEIKSDTAYIDALKSSLDETNNKLKKRFIPNWGISAAIMAGVDQKLNIDCYGILTVKKYFLDGHLFIGFGGGLKFYDKWGGSAVFEIGGNW